MRTSDNPNTEARDAGARQDEKGGEELLTPANLEEALARLDQILERLEQGTLPLEQLLQDYETGARLLRVCQERLSAAERRIQEVTKQFDGTLALHPMEPPENTQS